MIHKTSITRQKPYAGLSITKDNGGSLGTILISLSVLLVMFIIVFNIIDYSLYSFRKSHIGKGMDYAAAAAIQEIDFAGSSAGLEKGFDEATGQINVTGIRISETAADNAFYSTFEYNTGIKREAIEKNVLRVIINPVETGVEYIIKVGSNRYEGILSEAESLEAVINAKIGEAWTDPLSDKHVIFVNGNPKTNEFKERPYYLVFIKDFQIDGLLRNRTATFVGFKGAKIERS